MMQILALSRQNLDPSLRRFLTLRVAQFHQGFTLLEMLFLLVVIGLLTGLVVPRFSASYQLRELDSQRSDIEDQLRELPRRVRLTAHPLILPADLKVLDIGDGHGPLRLLDGWQISFEPPLEISLMGACSTTAIQLTNRSLPSVSRAYQIEGLDCGLSALSP